MTFNLRNGCQQQKSCYQYDVLCVTHGQPKKGNDFARYNQDTLVITMMSWKSHCHITKCCIFKLFYLVGSSLFFSSYWDLNIILFFCYLTKCFQVHNVKDGLNRYTQFSTVQKNLIWLPFLATTTILAYLKST